MQLRIADTALFVVQQGGGFAALDVKTNQSPVVAIEFRVRVLHVVADVGVPMPVAGDTAHGEDDILNVVLFENVDGLVAVVDEVSAERDRRHGQCTRRQGDGGHTYHGKHSHIFGL